MYSLTTIIHTSGYFIKLVQLWEPHNLETLQVRRGAPPADMLVFVREMVDYISCHRNRFTKLQDRIMHHWLRLDGMDPDSDEDETSSRARKKKERPPSDSSQHGIVLSGKAVLALPTSHTAARSRGWRLHGKWFLRRVLFSSIRFRTCRLQINGRD